MYGSTSFQLVDFNGDGKLDILYTCGDNADFSVILKPYHGVYIFLNQGEFSFKQAYFYPVNGCTKAIAKDFDGDGDLDIVTIAFFADFTKRPSESFIYFERDGALHFVPHSIPVSQYGRWISMDAGDVNGDGRPDVVLGNYSGGFGAQDSNRPSDNKFIPFILLSRSNP